MPRIYFDMCALKRPFDDQSQARIRLESEAVLALMNLGATEFVRSRAHDLENELNPLPARAARVRAWLGGRTVVDLPDAELEARTAELMSLGMKNFDAFHVAYAEGAGCDALVTTDDRLLALARRHAGRLRVRVLNPIDLASEVLP